MTREDKIKAIIQFFEENEDVFNQAIEELDAYNGWLNDDRYYYMEEMDELFHGESVSWILARAFYGYDETYGPKEEFNPNREYFRFSGYGNFVSTDYKDYSDYLDTNTIESMYDNLTYIDAITENPDLQELFEMLDEDDEDDEDDEA